MKNHKQKMINQMIWNAALGIVLMEVAGAITSVIDGMLTSQFIGSVALAANGMSGICFTVFAVISGVLSAGASEMCSEEIGKGNVKKSNQIFSMTIFVSVIISILIGLVGVVFSGQVAMLVGASKDTGELFCFARDYICGFMIGAPGHILIAVLIPAVQLCGQNKRMLASISALSIVDVVGDLLNVFVFHGGMFGMGLATSISYYVSMLVLLGGLRKSKLFEIHFRKLKFSGLYSVLKIGLPRATKRLGNIFRPLIMNRMILVAGGAVAMSAFSVEQNIRCVVESVGTGIAGSIFLLAGMFLGERDYDTLKATSKIAQKHIVIVVGGLAVIYFFAAPYIALMYVDAGSTLYKLAVSVLRCHAVSLPFNAYNDFYQNFIQAQKKYALTHIHMICNKFVCIIALCFVLAPHFGVFGLWLAIPLSEILLIVIVTIVNGIINIKNHNPDGFFALINASDDDPQTHLEIQLSEKEQLPHQMEKIRNFCEYNQLSEKQLYYLELFLEEIVVIVVEKGFAESKKKKKTIDIRIYIDTENVIIRTRDNGNTLTAVERIELAEKVQEGEYMGLQMVYKLAQDTNYITTMNMNNFIVKLAKE